jgi:hypothetical protein
VPANCGDQVGTSTKPFAVVSVIAWFSDDTASKQISSANILAGYGGVIEAPAAGVKVPEARYAGTAACAELKIKKDNATKSAVLKNLGAKRTPFTCAELNIK